jgi:hypothetical protein
VTKPDRIGLPALSVEQENAIDLLLTGKPDAEVAAALGVTRQTVCRWRGHHPVFRAELNRRRKALTAAHLDRLRTLVPKAIAALERAVDAGDWRAAAKALELVGPPEPDKAEPQYTDPMQYVRAVARAHRPSRSEQLLAGLDGGPPTDDELRQALAELLSAAEPAAGQSPAT